MTDAATPFKPADLWEHLVRAGVSKTDATHHVLLRVGNSPEKIQADYLKDVDPGKLASFGLGAADMASFGLGDQAARALWGKEATDTQQAAQQLHPTAHLAGEVAGVLGPLGLERGLALVGAKVAPTAIGAAVRGIKSVAGRAAAKTALNAAVGAGYAGAQAAGRTEGGLGPRLTAAKQAAPVGAAAGVLAPWLAASLGAAGSKFLGPVLKRVAGAAPAEVPAATGLLSPQTTQALQERIAQPIGGAFDDLAAAERDFAAGKIGKADYQTAVETADRQLRTQPRGLLSPQPADMQPLIPAMRAARDPLLTAPQLRTPLQQLGTGETLPYYPRGGQVEQALPPPPQVSPIGPSFPKAGHFLFNALGDNPLLVQRLSDAQLAAAVRFGQSNPGLAPLVKMLHAEAARRAGGLLQLSAASPGLLQP